MADYRIFETNRFASDLLALGASHQKRLHSKLSELVYPQIKTQPHFGPHIKKLQSWEPPTWRYRIADWRFFYEIDEVSKIVFMTAAEHRKSAYR